MNGANARNYRSYRVEVRERDNNALKLHKWEAIITKDGRHRVTLLCATEIDAEADANDWIDMVIEPKYCTLSIGSNQPNKITYHCHVIDRRLHTTIQS